MSLRAVLFDVDDTLVDHTGAQRQAILAQLRRVGMPDTEEQARRWAQIEWRHYTRYLDGELTLVEQRRERVRDMLGVRLADAAADVWFAGYQRLLKLQWSAFGDAAACLDTLQSAGLRVAVVSNVDSDWQRRKLARCGLGGYFDVIVGPDTLGVGKPDPRTFHHACHALGVAPAAALHVGDQIVSDVEGALAAGLAAAWLTRGPTSADGPLPALAVKVTGLAALADHVLTVS